MTTVEDDPGQDPQGGNSGQPGTAGAVLAPPPGSRRTRGGPRGPAAPAPGRAAGHWRLAAGRVRALVRRHPLFSTALALAAAVRLVVMLGYQPAILFRMDSFDYLWGAAHPSPNVVNPSGYSLFLWLLRPAHSLVLVTALQHLLGLGLAVLMYAVLRRYGLPGWGATLATLPVLFDPAQLLLEQLVMADVLAMALMVAGVALLLLLGERAPVWRLAVVGLLLGLSTVVRPTSLPLLVFVPAYLLIRRGGWRRAGAALAAGVLPVLGYMGWFAAAHGSFNMTNSDGLFLWTRTMSFANCAVIKPPADLQALCPQAQPPGLNQANPVQRPMPKYYLWDRRAWQWQRTPPVAAPDSAAFTQANNARALQFAERAILAQPLSYAHVVLHDASLTFRTTPDILRFPVSYIADQYPLPQGNLQYAMAAVKGYGGSTDVLPRLERERYATRMTQPFVAMIGAYQRVIFLPAPVLGLALLAGLAGLLIPSRRTWAGALLWLSAVVLMLLPTAEHEYTYRYVVPAVPLICMAAAFTFRKPRPARVPAAGAPAPSAAG